MSFKKKKWKYDLKNPGFKFRLSELNCALGYSQLKKLDKNVKQRIDLSKIYDSNFNDLNFFIKPNKKKNFKNSFHIYPLRIKFGKLKISKDKFIEYLSKKFSINVQVHYKPTHKFKYYNLRNEQKLPLSEVFYKEEVSLPLHLNLAKKQIIYVIKSILNIINKYKK